MSESSMLSFREPVPRVVVTRPAREAGQWVAQLQSCGIDAVALPLIDIGPVSDLRPVQEAWQRLGNYAAVMFVSANAVEHFFEGNKPQSSVKWSQSAIKTRAWSTGPGTSRALLLAGLDPMQIDAPQHDATQFDSEALWTRAGAQVQSGQRVLIVRGGNASGQGAGRDWLSDQLTGAGVHVDRLVAYRRLTPTFTGGQRTLVQQAATDGSVWLFSSSEAVGHLVAQFPDHDWHRARAVATHPRIAETARGAGFGVVCESLPTLGAVVSSIKSLQ